MVNSFDNRRTQMSINCSPSTRQKIDQVTAHLNPRQRSKYIMELIEVGIDNNVQAVHDAKSFPVKLCLACSQEEKERITDYCKNNLPKRSRSKWIVQLILDSQVAA